MAIERTLADVDQTVFAESEAKLITLLLAESPELDLRQGTALRDLIIRPAAQFHALNGQLNEDLRNSQSVKLIAENPEVADEDTLDNILANMGVTRQAGGFATGLVMVVVNVQKNYTLPVGYSFVDAAGTTFATTQDFSIRAFDEPIPPNELALFPFTSADLAGKYYFLLPVQAAIVGTTGNIAQGTALGITGQAFTGIESASAYAAFSGGSAEETIEEVLARLPATLSLKAFESSVAISTRIQETLTNVVAVSSVGFGDDAQLRDKHNVLGVAVGSRVDVYLRTGREPQITILEKTATKVSDGVYTFSIAAAEAPGFYKIRGISSLEDVESADLPIIGSFPFTEERSSSGTSGSFHDFDVNNLVVETAYTVFQTSTVTVTNVAPSIIDGAAVYQDTINLKVELYAPTNLVAAQAFVDNDALRNLEGDHLIRGAIPCFTSISANVFHKKEVEIDLTEVNQALADFVNSKDFGETVTASQISAILHQFDIVRVNELQLSGSIRAADGQELTLTGADIDPNLVRTPELLVTTDTVIFMQDTRDIFIITREL